MFVIIELLQLQYVRIGKLSNSQNSQNKYVKNVSATQFIDVFNVAACQCGAGSLIFLPLDRARLVMSPC